MFRRKRAERREVFSRISPLKFGLAVGLFFVIAMLFISLMISAGASNTVWVPLVEIFYIGYSLTFWGIIIGVAYGFVEGFLGAWLIALFYNHLLNY